MYKEIIKQDRKRRFLLDKNNWKWDINKSDRPAYYIDSQGLDDADYLIRQYIGDTSGVLITTETDHRDKDKRLVVIKFVPGSERAAMYRLSESDRTTSDLYIAWLTRTTATKISEWHACASVPDSIECIISVGVLSEKWESEAVKSQRGHVLRFLHQEMDVPVSGRLYLDYDNGTPRLIWHSCPICDQPPSVMERFFGNWWGRHIPDQWGCEKRLEYVVRGRPPINY